LEWIEAQLRLRRNYTAIYQDLVDQFGFTGAYNSVKRFAGRLVHRRTRESRQRSRRNVVNSRDNGREIACNINEINYLSTAIRYLSESLRRQLHNMGKTAQADAPAGTYSRAILNRLLIDWHRVIWRATPIPASTPGS
jgi:hypothetical protein